MKLWALAGLFTVAAVPFAGAAEASPECQVDETRRAPQVRIDNGAPGGSAPPIATPTVQPAAPRDASAERAAPSEAAPPMRTAVERRRNGKQVPDAELIAPRRVL